MPTYTVTAINIGSFPLGESDKVLTLFSRERGIVRAVAKGARKPGTKMSGKSDVLTVNKLLLATGRSLDIITQAEGIESYPELRHDLVRLSFALYYAELTQHFGQGLSEEAQGYFDYLCQSVRIQSDPAYDPIMLCLTFELGLLNMLGYKPELDACVVCRKALTDYNIAVFHHELGGIICEQCFSGNGPNEATVSESKYSQDRYFGQTEAFSRNAKRNYGWERTHITPLVWKSLVLAGNSSVTFFTSNPTLPTNYSKQVMNTKRAAEAARRIIQSYIEHRAGKKMKSLDILTQLQTK
jgi:DNA repair protein RecO (recombination protein O)